MDEVINCIETAIGHLSGALTECKRNTPNQLRAMVYLLDAGSAINAAFGEIRADMVAPRMSHEPEDKARGASPGEPMK